MVVIKFASIPLDHTHVVVELGIVWLPTGAHVKVYIHNQCDFIDTADFYASTYAYSDINECAIDMDGCAHDCINTIGSYVCSCRTGYRLASNGHSCLGKMSV